MLRPAAAAAAGLLLAGCSGTPAVAPAPRDAVFDASSAALTPAAGGRLRTFDLVARPARWELEPGLAVQAWTYNGTVPGPLLRVTAGDLVEVRLVNRLPEGTTIHWYGLGLPYAEDGEAGISQPAIPPGESGVYRFVAARPGTYWYHSGSFARDQVDRGLYGALVVDPAGAAPPADEQVLVYDEWPAGLESRSPPPRGDVRLDTYITDSVNGHTGQAIAPVRFRPGVPLVLRLVNAGFDTHVVQVAGAEAAISAIDGRSLAGGPPLSGAIPLAAGQRVDVTLASPTTAAAVRLLDGIPPADDVVVPVLPVGASPPKQLPAAPEPARAVDYLGYSGHSGQPVWPAGQGADRQVTLTLSEVPSAGHPPLATPGMRPLAGRLMEIDGSAFPATGELLVRPGERVQLTFDNRSDTDHAMYLHGHSLQLLSLDGRPAAGSLVFDTVLVPPRGQVSVGLVAGNPGVWPLLCEELDHAAAGMMILVRYEGLDRLASIDAGSGSVP